MRVLRVMVTLICVVALPLSGTVLSAQHAATTIALAGRRELVFAEILTALSTAALALVLAWLTVSAVTGSAAAVAYLTRSDRADRAGGWRHRRAPAGSPHRSPRGSVVAAAVTALVLLAAGTQAASAATTTSAQVTAATSDDVTVATTAGGVTADRAVQADPAGAAHRAAVAEPAPVGGWTPRMSPLSPETTQLMLGAPPTALSHTTSDSTSDTHADTPAGAPHVVLRGESLWTIAADHLGPGASATEIAAAWPRWWQANADVIGDDPDLLLPGQRLRPPT